MGIASHGNLMRAITGPNSNLLVCRWLRNSIGCFLFALLLCAMNFRASSQSVQSEYLEGKRQYRLGNYKEASDSFKSISNNPTFGQHASFFFALSSYYAGEQELAYNMWKQLLSKYPTWSQAQEVRFWLLKTGLELGRYEVAFEASATLTKRTRNAIVRDHLETLAYDSLRGLQKDYPENSAIAKILMERIAEQPFTKQNQQLIRTLEEKFDLKLASPSAELPKKRKDKYSIAAFLPFMNQGISNPTPVLRNKIMTELYQGMQLAIQQLLEEEIEVQLYPYDTHKSVDTTASIFQENDLSSVDLIIGPLYEGPNEFVKSFATANKINMINPLSSNHVLLDSS
ncbi:MAG: hypothetical protein AAF789_10485, partial [Bacteroidota bacterium]